MVKRVDNRGLYSDPRVLNSRSELRNFDPGAKERLFADSMIKTKLYFSRFANEATGEVVIIERKIIENILCLDQFKILEEQKRGVVNEFIQKFPELSAEGENWKANKQALLESYGPGAAKRSILNILKTLQKPCEFGTIAELSGFGRPMVSKYLGELVEEGLVVKDKHNKTWQIKSDE